MSVPELSLDCDLDLYFDLLDFYTTILIIDGMILIFDLDHFHSDLLYLCL